MEEPKVKTIEIVQLANGEFIARKAGEKKPLMTVKLSDEVKLDIDDQHETLASKMLLLGVQLMTEMSLKASEEEVTHTIH